MDKAKVRVEIPKVKINIKQIETNKIEKYFDKVFKTDRFKKGDYLKDNDSFCILAKHFVELFEPDSDEKTLTQTMLNEIVLKKFRSYSISAGVQYERIKVLDNFIKADYNLIIINDAVEEFTNLNSNSKSLVSVK